MPSKRLRLRLTHRINSEHAGFSIQAFERDVSNKILCDNPQALTAAVQAEVVGVNYRGRMASALARSIFFPRPGRRTELVAVNLVSLTVG
jgi:hypothetical protein